MIKKWKRLSRETINENAHGGYYHDEFETADGVKGDYFYHSNDNAVTVFVQMDDEKFAMIREYRYLFDKISVSQVQGGIEKGEAPEESARREVEEEVGFKPKTMIHVGKFASAPAFSTEEVDVFIARDLEKSEQKMNSKEYMEVVPMSAHEIDAAILSGEIWDGQVTGPWGMVKLFLEEEKNKI